MDDWQNGPGGFGEHDYLNGPGNYAQQAGAYAAGQLQEARVERVQAYVTAAETVAVGVAVGAASRRVSAWWRRRR